MALEDSAKLNLSLKKILGKAQTSNSKEVYNESLGSNVSIGASTVFGVDIPTYASSSFFTIISGTVEKVRLNVSPIEGTKDSNGKFQGFQLSLPSDYQANSSNSKAGTAPFTNSSVLNASNGKLQLVPPSFGSGYTATVYHTSSGLTQITALDARDWVLDYFNGVFFQQDPPTNVAENPVFVDAFVFVGNFVDTLLQSGGGSGNATGQGPTNSLQFHTGSGGISGSANLKFTNNTLMVTGSLIVSGNIQAHTFDIIQTTLTEISSSGSTNFGNSSDDTHKFQGKHLQLDSGLVVKRIRISSSQTIGINNYYVGVDSFTPSASVTVTLPDAATLQNGQVYVIKDEGGKADLYNVLIKASGSQLIDNQNQVVLESPHASLTLYCDGASKFYIG